MSTQSKKKQVTAARTAGYKPRVQRRQSALDLMRSLHDVGNGRRIVQRYGEVLRFNSDANRWMVWDGRRFTLDRTGEAFRLATETASSLLERSAQHELTSHEGRKVEEWVRSSHSRRGIEAALETASNQKTDDGKCIRLSGSDLNRNPMQLNVLNGTYDLERRTLSAHTPADAISYLAPVKLNPKALSPRWSQFLTETFCGDRELIGHVQKLVGYSITGISSEQILIILNGGGANGKGVFTSVISEILGDYAKTLTVRSLTTAASNDIRGDLASLPGSRFVTASEGNSNDRFDEALVKLLTGEDPIRARFLYQNDFTFKMTGKVWLQTNHLPRISGSDRAIWRRILVVPFDQTVRESNEDAQGPIRDDRLKGKLLRESSGILNWMLEGCARWQTEGLGACVATENASAEYREREDTVTAFMRVRCRDNPAAATLCSALYNAYEDWCAMEGHVPKSQTAFGNAVRQAYGQTRDAKGQRVRLGIELLRFE